MPGTCKQVEKQGVQLACKPGFIACRISDSSGRDGAQAGAQATDAVECLQQEAVSPGPLYSCSGVVALTKLQPGTQAGTNAVTPNFRRTLLVNQGQQPHARGHPCLLIFINAQWHSIEFPEISRLPIYKYIMVRCWIP